MPLQVRGQLLQNTSAIDQKNIPSYPVFPLGAFMEMMNISISHDTWYKQWKNWSEKNIHNTQTLDDFKVNDFIQKITDSKKSLVKESDTQNPVIDQIGEQNQIVVFPEQFKGAPSPSSLDTFPTIDGDKLRRMNESLHVYINPIFIMQDPGKINNVEEEKQISKKISVDQGASPGIPPINNLVSRLQNMSKASFVLTPVNTKPINMSDPEVLKYYLKNVKYLSDEEIVRFNNSLKYVLDTLKPKPGPVVSASSSGKLNLNDDKIKKNQLSTFDNGTSNLESTTVSSSSTNLVVPTSLKPLNNVTISNCSSTPTLTDKMLFDHLKQLSRSFLDLFRSNNFTGCVNQQESIKSFWRILYHMSKEEMCKIDPNVCMEVNPRVLTIHYPNLPNSENVTLNPVQKGKFLMDVIQNNLDEPPTHLPTKNNISNDSIIDIPQDYIPINLTRTAEAQLKDNYELLEYFLDTYPKIDMTQLKNDYNLTTGKIPNIVYDQFPTSKDNNATKRVFEDLSMLESFLDNLPDPPERTLMKVKPSNDKLIPNSTNQNTVKGLNSTTKSFVRNASKNNSSNVNVQPTTVKKTSEKANSNTDEESSTKGKEQVQELKEMKDLLRRFRLLGLNFLDLGHFLLNNDAKHSLMPKTNNCEGKREYDFPLKENMGL